MADRRYALLGHSHASSGTAWGSITGTLSAQTDLQSALDAKAPTSHTHSLTDVTDVTALAAELNLLDLSGLTAGWVLSADTASTASWKAPAGGGDVTKVGTPANDQIGVWTGDGTIEGQSTFKYSSTTGIFEFTRASGTATYRMGATTGQNSEMGLYENIPSFGAAYGMKLKMDGSTNMNHIMSMDAGIEVEVIAFNRDGLDISLFDDEFVFDNSTATPWFRIYDGGKTDYVEMSHDGTDMNFAHTNTTDLNVTGITSFNVPALDVTGAITVGGLVDGVDIAGLSSTVADLPVANLADGTDGELITWSAAGAPTTVPVGTATHVLTSNGAGAAPTFQAAAGGGFTPKSVMYVGSGSGAISATTSWVTVDLATEYYDAETNYSLATDIITVTDAGYYLISYVYTYHPTGGATNDSVKCRMTKNGTSTVLPGSTSQELVYKANTRPCQVTCTFLASLAASDTVRLQQACETGTSGTELGTSINVTLTKVG